MGYSSYLLLLPLLLFHVEGAATNCGHTYQQVLRDMETLQESCNLAAFKDCCQVLSPK